MLPDGLRVACALYASLLLALALYTLCAAVTLLRRRPRKDR
jgi:hypothetical protein